MHAAKSRWLYSCTILTNDHNLYINLNLGTDNSFLICIKATGFLESCLAIRPSFNDHSSPKPIETAISDTETKFLPSLRTPLTSYAKKIRFSVLEFDPLLDSSSINAKGMRLITIYSLPILFLLLFFFSS